MDSAVRADGGGSRDVSLSRAQQYAFLMLQQRNRLSFWLLVHTGFGFLKQMRRLPNATTAQ